ncbi:hypothetical protein [Clostridium sp.]|uniref:hypothetical protein n=1 Tax=Clostridium sp. TaxID=1506 RepID=UPI003D6C8935
MLLIKRLLLIPIGLLICSFILVGCKGNNPEIKTVITLSNITEQEYNNNDLSKSEGASIDDIKKLYINVKISNSKKAEERTIIIPDLSIVLNGHDKVRAVGGGTTEQNNVGKQDTADSMAFVIFDSRGLSEQDIRNLYSKSEIKIEYKLKNSNMVESKITIGKDLMINNKN